MPFYSRYKLINNVTVKCALESSKFKDQSNSFSFLNMSELNSIRLANTGYTVTGINYYYTGTSNAPIYAGAVLVKTSGFGTTTPTITYSSDDWEEPNKIYVCIRLRGVDQGNGYHYAAWNGYIDTSMTTKSFTVADNVVMNQSLVCSFGIVWNSGTVKFTNPSVGLRTLGGSISLLLGSFDAVEVILSMGTVTV